MGISSISNNVVEDLDVLDEIELEIVMEILENVSKVIQSIGLVFD